MSFLSNVSNVTRITMAPFVWRSLQKPWNMMQTHINSRTPDFGVWIHSFYDPSDKYHLLSYYFIKRNRYLRQLLRAAVLRIRLRIQEFFKIIFTDPPLIWRPLRWKLCFSFIFCVRVLSCLLERFKYLCRFNLAWHLNENLLDLIPGQAPNPCNLKVN